jgi:hypothetical protein
MKCKSYGESATEYSELILLYVNQWQQRGAFITSQRRQTSIMKYIQAFICSLYDRINLVKCWKPKQHVAHEAY